MMNTQSDFSCLGGGSADKREKTNLLREITYLSRLIQQHDYKNKPASNLGSSVMKNQVSKNKCLNVHQWTPSGAISYSDTVQLNELQYSDLQTSNHSIQKMSLRTSNSVFVNPKKLNCQLLQTPKRIQKQNNFAAVDIMCIPHKVYVNPCFLKKESPTNKPVCKPVAGRMTNNNTLGTVNKKIYINGDTKFYNKNNLNQNIKNILPANNTNKNPDIYRIIKSQKPVGNINQQHLGKMMSYKKHSQSNSSITSMSRDNQVNIVDQKPKSESTKNTNILRISDENINSSSHLIEFKNETVASSEKSPVQKQEVQKTDGLTLERNKSVCPLQDSSKNSEQFPGKEIVPKICKSKLNNNSIKKSSSLCTPVQPQKMRDIKGHRRRSSSTCLVAVSKTKMVRKHKSDINTKNINFIPVQKKKLMKPLQPVNHYKLNKVLKLKNVAQNIYSVNNNPFKLVKFKPGIKALPTKANSNNRDKFNLMRRKSSVSSSGSSKFKLVVAQQNMKQSLSPVETVTLLQSKFPSKVKGKNLTIKSKYLIIKKGCENTTNIQNKKRIHLTKDARNKWFSSGDTAMILAKKTKLRTEKSKNEINKKIRSPPGSELMAVSRTKLVRKPISEIKRIQKLKTEYKHEAKLTPSVKMAYRVKNKYRFIRNQLSTSNVTAVRYIRPKQSQLSQESRRSRSTLKKHIAPGILKKRCSLIKIGDAYYRASHNKLTRKNPVRASGSSGSVFKVQGKKCILQKGRHSLKYFRVMPLQLSKVKNNSASVRLKIGTSNTPWSRLVQAKQRSIALLTNRLRKNNQPCLMFNRFGRCAGKDKGTCNKLHDLKNIAICKRFVQGCCENTTCLLSHNVGPEKMPTCHHFLAGNCMRENCPYLHVKLSKKAPLCLAFLQGYCADAANCQKRHEHICPEFEEKGACPKGKYCPYPHPREKNIHSRSSEQCKKGTECMKNSVEENEEETNNVVSSCRYFEENTAAGEIPSAEYNEESACEDSTVHTDNDTSSCWINKRPKIGDLPGYIPLMNKSEDKIT